METIKASTSKLVAGLKASETSCANLKEALEKSQVDVFNVGDLDFDRAKDQVACLYPDINISTVDFFKEIVDGKLVD